MPKDHPVSGFRSPASGKVGFDFGGESEAFPGTRTRPYASSFIPSHSSSNLRHPHSLCRALQPSQRPQLWTSQKRAAFSALFPVWLTLYRLLGLRSELCSQSPLNSVPRPRYSPYVLFSDWLLTRRQSRALKPTKRPTASLRPRLLDMPLPSQKQFSRIPDSLIPSGLDTAPPDLGREIQRAEVEDFTRFVVAFFVVLPLL